MKKLYKRDSKIHGTGIHAGEEIGTHEHIAFIKGRERIHKSATAAAASEIPLWYGLTERTWIDPTGTIWCYLNHSCDPNCAIVGTRKLIARRTITTDEELTIDYSMTDGDVLWEMSCSCKAKNCRKKIVSIQKIPESYFNNHLPLIPKYFQKLRKKYLASDKM
jgi:hypothetical protein